jgi:hypothetical protein
MVLTTCQTVHIFCPHHVTCMYSNTRSQISQRVGHVIIHANLMVSIGV